MAATPAPSDTVIKKTRLVISDFKEANFEERDLVQISDGAVTGTDSDSLKQTELFEIDEVSLEAGHEGPVIASNVASSKVAANDHVIMQGSLNNDPQGLKALTNELATDKLHSVTRDRRWSAEVIDKSSLADSDAGKKISTDLMNEMMLKIKKKCGKSPNLIICSYTQYEKILNMLESKKQFNVNTRAGLKSKSGADISFSGVEFMSIDGAVGIFPERFIEDDRIYFLNDAHIHIYHRPDFGWFDDDGTVFLRKAGEDEYEARYGGYPEVYMNPCFHGVIKGLLDV